MIDPFEEFRRMKREMKRMYRMMGYNMAGFKSINTDLIDNGDSYNVVFEIPGFEKNEVEININENSITIKANKKEKKDEEEKNYIYKERFSSSIFRTLSLPESVDPDSAKANYKNGILTIEVKKAKEKGRTIKIE